MKIEVNMTTDDQRFSVCSWWARDPDFVLATLHAQLEAAGAIWPELKKWSLTTPTPDESALSPAISNPIENTEPGA